MRRLFIILFILSLGATVATIYWRTYKPEGPAIAAAPQPRTRGLDQERGGRLPSAQMASDRQDLAVTISIVSSIVSAIAALLQTWLTAKALPKRGG